MTPRRTLTVLGVLLALTLAVPASGSATGATARQRAAITATTPQQAAALGRQAYVYGFPLLESERVRRTETSVRCPDGGGDSPVNSFSTATGYARPSERTVVAPNVDTLYSIAHLDLGRGPVVLSHPAMGRRYFVFELLDPYTNTIGYIGSRTTGARAGRFAITWTRHPGRRVPGATVVRSAYRRVWVIGRTLAGGQADQRRAVALMRRYALTPPGGPRRFASHCRPGKPLRAKTPTGLAFLDALGTALAENPPPNRDGELLHKLAAVGIGPGRRPQPAGLPGPVLSALIGGVDQAASALPTDSKSDVLAQAKRGHGWAIPGREIGDYGTHYRYRAEIATVGLGANTRQEAIYPTALTDAAGHLLTGTASYRIVFPRGDAPPVRAFWSLTMYDLSGYLVANRQHRYAIGSNHPPLRRRADGSIVVVLSHTRPRQPQVNWLPAPAGAFRVNLRLYWPKARALRGLWRPPPIVPISPS